MEQSAPFEALDDYSRLVLSAVLGDHSEWASLVQYDKGGFEIAVPGPAAGRPALVIWSELDELSIGFDRWHTHFDGWNGPSRLGLPWDARSFVTNLLAEELAVAVQMNEDKWGGSWLVLNPAEGPELDEPLRAGQRVYVRSWAGRWDAEYHAT